jgi:outer membrane protein assembly factor BamB
VAVDGGRLYVTTITWGSLYCIEVRSGEIEWRYSPADVYSFPMTPTIVDDTAYVVRRDSGLVAVATETGKRRWALDVEQPLEFSSSPVHADGLLYLGGDRFYAIDPQSESLRWQVDLDGTIPATPAVSGANAYVTTTRGSVYMIDVASRSIEWHRRIGTGPIYHGPVASNDTVYVSDAEGKVFALSGSTGSTEWVFDARWILSAPLAVTADGVYVASNEPKFYSLFPESGGIKWESAAPGFQSGGLVVTEDVVFASGGRGIVGLDRDSGQTVYDVAIDCDPVSTPVAVGNTLFVGCEDHRIHALTPATQ